MSDLTSWWAELLAAHEERSAAVHDGYQQLENAGLIGRVVVHRYICAKAGCKLATVVRVGEDLIVRTRDYKLAPGTNVARSVEAARATNTLDGARHWPGHTFDVRELATWGEAAGVDMNCRHRLRTILAVDILTAVAGVRPGHPAAPTRC